MKNKNIIIIILIVFVFLISTVYAETNACENKSPCLQSLPDVQQKIEELQKLSINDVTYASLQERSADITVSVQALYEEAFLYKNLAQLRTEIEGLPQEALEKRVIVLPEQEIKGGEEIITVLPEMEIEAEIGAQVPEPYSSKEIILDGSRLNPFGNVKIFFFEGKWGWCPLSLFSNDCSEKITDVAEHSPAKNEIGLEHYTLIYPLYNMTFNEGLEHLLLSLVELRISDSSMIFKVEDLGDISTETSKTLQDTVDIEVDDETFKAAIAVTYEQQTLPPKPKREILGLAKLQSYNSALKKLKESLVKEDMISATTEICKSKFSQDFISIKQDNIIMCDENDKNLCCIKKEVEPYVERLREAAIYQGKVLLITDPARSLNEQRSSFLDYLAGGALACGPSSLTASEKRELAQNVPDTGSNREEFAAEWLSENDKEKLDIINDLNQYNHCRHVRGLALDIRFENMPSITKDLNKMTESELEQIKQLRRFMCEQGWANLGAEWWHYEVLSEKYREAKASNSCYWGNLVGPEATAQPNYA